MTALDWRADAACKGRTDLFTAHRADVTPAGLARDPGVIEAIRICEQCPVLVECATWAARIDLLEVRSMPGFVLGGVVVPSRRRPSEFRAAVSAVARHGRRAVA